MSEAKRKAGGQVGPRANRICNCGTCNLCLARIRNERYRTRKRLGLPRIYGRSTKLDLPEQIHELMRLDESARKTLEAMRNYRAQEPLHHHSPLTTAIERYEDYY